QWSLGSETVADTFGTGAVKHGLDSGRCHLENSAGIVVPASAGDPVKVSVVPEGQARCGMVAVKMARDIVESVEHLVDSGGADAEDDSLVQGAALVCGAIEVAVVSLHQVSERQATIVGSTKEIVES